MAGIILIALGILFVGIGTQVPRENAKERALGMKAAGASSVPFYVIGALLGIVGVLVLIGIIHVGSLLQ